MEKGGEWGIDHEREGERKERQVHMMKWQRMHDKRKRMRGSYVPRQPV
jgi:hypothetical protein